MWATIIAAIIGIAGTAISAGVNSKNTKRAKKESLSLANIARGDELDKTAKDYKLSSENMEMNKESLAIKKRESSYNMSMNDKSIRQSQIATLGQSLSNMQAKDQNMSKFILSLYGKGAR